VFELESEDGWVEGYRKGLAASVRRKLGGTPTSTLDLHRHDSDTARRRVARFVARESEQGTELVLVIVGRGLHSPTGRAVLRDEISAWLSSLPASRHVLAFRTARRELGGSGAVVVLLARRG
jgi:DNA-nicking Smr family endonuclease